MTLLAISSVLLVLQTAQTPKASIEGFVVRAGTNEAIGRVRRRVGAAAFEVNAAGDSLASICSSRIRMELATRGTKGTKTADAFCG